MEEMIDVETFTPTLGVISNGRVRATPPTAPKAFPAKRQTVRQQDRDDRPRQRLITVRESEDSQSVSPIREQEPDKRMNAVLWSLLSQRKSNEINAGANTLAAHMAFLCRELVLEMEGSKTQRAAEKPRMKRPSDGARCSCTERRQRRQRQQHQQQQQHPIEPERSIGSNSMAAECLTTLTEQWIRDRLQLTHPCLGDVRSLSLPGTSEQRIAHLGTALNNFVRLRSLDLSYNALISIEGLQHLKKLERLILYHNLIPSFEELKVLFGLSALKELDLRLNPLTKSFPHYRLYLIDAMPNLRKLDNYSVRDTERKASSMQLSPDVFSSKKKYSPIPSESQRKTDQKLGLAARLSTTDSNNAVLNFVETNPADHLGVDTEDKESKGFHLKQNSKIKGPTSSLKVADKPKVSFAPHIENHPPVPGSLKHSRRSARGFFTANPDQSPHHSSLINIRPSSPRNPDVILSDPSNPILHPPRLSYSSLNKTEQSSSLPQQAERKRGGYRKPLEMLLNLIDKHWKGEPSLPHNNFLSQAVQILSMMESDISSSEAEVKTLRQEVGVLGSRATSREEEHKAEVGNLSAQLEDARQAVGELNKQLRTVLEENVALQKKLLDLETLYLKSLMKSLPSAQVRDTQREVEELRREIEGLRRKVLETEEVREGSDMLLQVSGGNQ